MPRDEQQQQQMSASAVSLSYRSLCALALPSILLQSGAPIAITVQTALLGRKSTDLLAAWAIVASTSLWPWLKPR